jgi:phage terminase large subunit
MRVKSSIPIAFKPIFDKSRYKVFYGGRGSGKSWAISEFLVIQALTNPRTRILCTREIQNSIKESVHKLIADTVERLKLTRQFNITNHAITCQNGSEFIFMGLLRNVDQIKSTEGIDYFWVSEAHNV